ncbi:hypothetical protein ANCDUO_05107 [Ancylostoma duodenale]|uniref:Uncharacterized protein n=1 Tax=Ancylostoma duodenale TaxID=51022 RepID=A0A0C2GTH0_9BILA|nr:hypothetical protein ANCDUO_05107 [Ancylostoma duodenale]
MFFPYIVCASIYTVISGGDEIEPRFSTCGVGFFLGSTIYSLATRTRARDHAYATGIFLLLLVFWYWSLRTVKTYRNYISKISGEHVIFNNPEYV